MEPPRPDMPGIFQKSEKLVLALLESASQGVISIDRTGRIVLANRRAEEMFGYSREELLGARIEILLPESKRGGHTRERDQYFSSPTRVPWASAWIWPGAAMMARSFPSK